MFIAHLPAGYLLAQRLKKQQGHSSSITLVALIGAIAPDLDLFYFYLIDQRQVHHHTYFPHWPILWLGLLLLSLLLWRMSERKTHARLAMAFSLSGLLHMMLDSLVGDIWWLAPWLDQPFALFTVPARFQPWWLNFLLHWSFAVELAIVSWGLLSFSKRRNAA